jgi:hypothetical protein
MFRILCDPSSESTELCLTGVTRSGSQIFCTAGWEQFPAARTVHTHHRFKNYAAKHRPSTRQNICEPLRVISVKRSSVLSDDGLHKIRNMSE